MSRRRILTSLVGLMALGLIGAGIAVAPRTAADTPSPAAATASPLAADTSPAGSPPATATPVPTVGAVSGCVSPAPTAGPAGPSASPSADDTSAPAASPAPPADTASPTATDSGAATAAPVASATPSAASCSGPTCPALKVHIPKVLDNLVVVPESACAALSQRPTDHASAVDGISFNSLRVGTQVQATLEVAHLVDAANPTDPDNQATIAAELGGTSPLKMHAGLQTFYVSTEKGLTFITWFRDRYVFILSIRDSYTKPKELARAAFGITP